MAAKLALLGCLSKCVAEPSKGVAESNVNIASIITNLALTILRAGAGEIRPDARLPRVSSQTRNLLLLSRSPRAQPPIFTIE